MARITRLSREDLGPDDQRRFDHIVELRGSAGGLYGLLLNSPELADRVAATEAYLRFECDLPDSLKEVAILATAQSIKSQYEYAAHARLSRQAGVPEGVIRAIAHGDDVPEASTEEQAAICYVRELVQDLKVSDSTFNTASELFGAQGVVDLTVLVGHYIFIGQFLAALEVELAPGVTPELTV